MKVGCNINSNIWKYTNILKYEGVLVKQVWVVNNTLIKLKNTKKDTWPKYIPDILRVNLLVFPPRDVPGLTLSAEERI